ncbi:cytochrome P450 4V2 [Nephila pilipes]|uniref:Cytochrome P450 4V2 n=1 Tax=Nephila pilipes TaxID=299642 RepID=A0A8X6MS10_NEPPI|nr:cytochrome P450 4V2 [Nephila pilipes]
MLFLFLTASVLGIIIVFLKYSLWRHKCSQGMPGKKQGFFNVLGDLKDMFAYENSNDKYALHHHFIKVLKNRTELYQKQQLFSWWALYVPFVFLVKADAVKAVMKGFKTIDKSRVYNILKPLSGSGLGNLPSEEWKPRRKLLAPCFHTDILRVYMDVFNEHSQKLARFFSQETKKEFTYVKKPITLVAMDILCETVFGIQIGAFENEEDSGYVKSLHSLTEIYISRIYKFWQWPKFLFKFTKTYREMKFHEQVCHDFVTKVIREKKKSYLNRDMEYEKGKRKAVLDLLLELYSDSGELSEENIREDLKVFVFGGHDTASIAMTWALFLIGLYPDVQAKIHDELDRIFGDDVERYVTENDLNELKYLDCVIKETNRLYSPAPMFGRQIHEETNICGHTIPKGASCIVLAHFLHRDEDVFPDPEKFDPDRFLPENSSNIPEFAFVPFAAGPRNCIGQRYATMEMKTMLSTILRSFTVESLDGRDKVLPLMLITLHPSIPIRIKIRARKLRK